MPSIEIQCPLKGCLCSHFIDTDASQRFDSTGADAASLWFSDQITQKIEWNNLDHVLLLCPNCDRASYFSRWADVISADEFRSLELRYETQFNLIHKSPTPIQDVPTLPLAKPAYIGKAKRAYYSGKPVDWKALADYYGSARGDEDV